MYTLRTFKDKGEINRTQIYLGDSYVVKGACEGDEKLGIKLRVHGNWDSHTKEGLAIYNDDHAFVMTQLGGTLETLNRPKAQSVKLSVESDKCINCGNTTFYISSFKAVCVKCQHQIEITPQVESNEAGIGLSDEEYMAKMNTSIVGDFIKFCDENNMPIHDSAFELYFNA